MRYFIMAICLAINFDAGALSSVQAIDPFEPAKYVGTWYEIARLPMFFERNCRVPITANYQINPNNDGQILVKNSCYQADGSIRTAQGVATFSDKQSIAKLEVSFLPKILRWIPFTKADYWVLYTDYDQVALVGMPNHKYMWILSRTPQLPPSYLNKAVEIAKQQGFATEQLIFN